MTTSLGKELFIRFTASAFRKLPSVYIFSYFPFGFEGRMWDLIVSVPDHCLSFYFAFYETLGLPSTNFRSSIWCALCMICRKLVHIHIVFTRHSDFPALNLALFYG